MIKAVVFDLDDTLYPEEDYVKSGLAAVSEEISRRYGTLDALSELKALYDADSKGVFDRYALNHGLDNTAAAALVETYREHTPDIRLTKEVSDMLLSLREKGLKLGVITDGRPSGQRKKIDALGLENTVDKVIITDELGGIEYRKPNPKSFELMCAALNSNPEETVYVGDNPQKDFAVKEHLPIKTIRLTSQNGVYKNATYLNNIKPDYVVDSVSNISSIVENINKQNAFLIEVDYD